MDVNPSLLSGVTALVRAELEQETAAGFPKLKRIPSAGIIRFLDYWDSLPSREHASPVDALAGLGALHFFPPPFFTKMHEELRTTNAACLRMYAAMKSPQFAYGLGAKGEKKPGGEIVYEGGIGRVPLKVTISISNLSAHESCENSPRARKAAQPS